MQHIPKTYPQILADIKTEIRQARLRAEFSTNPRILALYIQTFVSVNGENKKHFDDYEFFVHLRNNRKHMEKLTPQEEQAMQAIWKTGEGIVKVFLENMEKPLPPYTTLASTIKNLEKKGYLSSRLIGNSYLYKPVISEEAYKNKFMNNMVKNYFANSYKELVSFFVQQKKLSAKELKEIIDMIEKQK